MDHTAPTTARNRLIKQYLPLVHHVVGKLLPTNSAVARLGRAEAVAVGNLALVRAAHGFDPDYGAKFKTYAYRCVWRQILNAAMDQSVIHVPRAVDGDQRYEPTTVEAAHRARYCVVSLNENVPDPHDPDSGTDTEDVDESEFFAGIIGRAGLTVRQREAVELRLRERLSVVRIAERMGLSRERVRQLLARAVWRFQVALGLVERVAPARVTIL